MLAGMLVLIPTYLTATVLVAMVRWTDGVLHLLPARFRPEAILGHPVPGLGVVVSLVVLILAGTLVATVMGRAMVSGTEALLRRLPLLRWFYFSSKEVLEAIFAPGSKSFRRVVLVEYPRKGLYTIGLVSGEAMQDLSHGSGAKCHTVFLATTPNPTTGLQIVVPEEQIHHLRWGVDDAISYVVSVGVITPKEQIHVPDGEVRTGS